MKLRPKKYLGQNFLVDPNIRQKIVSSCELKPTDIILEIGPGRGALTKMIAPLVKETIAIEKDKDLIDPLKEEFKNTNVTIVHADILKYPFLNLPFHVKAVGNLPYNIATAVIEKLLLHREHFDGCYLTVQLEHANRLTARPHTKDYGSFSCFVQYYAEIKKLFRIKNTAFWPAPKIQSCFIKMIPFKEAPFKTLDERFLFKVIQKAFNQRRKTIRNSLSKLIDKENLLPALKTLHISPQSRAENLSLQDFIDIADLISLHPSL